MTVATTTMRQLIPFLMDNGETSWDNVLENEIFDAIINSPPPLYGLENPEFEILGLSSIHGVDEKANEGRAGGTRLKKKDLNKGWDPSERPLIVVRIDGDLYLWDGFNRYWKLSDLGVTSLPAWVYDLKEGYDIEDVKEVVQLSANNTAQSDEHTKRDFINSGVKWSQRHNIEDLDKIKGWVSLIDHNWTDKEVDRIAATILCESETTQVKHIPTGSKAKKLAYDFVDGDLSYKEEGIANPIVLCTKEDDYIKDAFMSHMKKFVQDDKEGELETTELIGYTKGCESPQEVKVQREHAKELFDELDDLVIGYAMLKMKLNGKAPYIWKGFLPQLYDIEIGDGIPHKLWD